MYVRTYVCIYLFQCYHYFGCLIFHHNDNIIQKDQAFIEKTDYISLDLQFSVARCYQQLEPYTPT
jgi:hypothetical protein